MIIYAIDYSQCMLHGHTEAINNSYVSKQRKTFG